MNLILVPEVLNSKVINKSILYYDRVLNAQNFNRDMKVSCVSGVGLYSLENCIKTILSSNLDVVFNTIQYSHEDKKVYFYADKEVSMKLWQEKNKNIFKSITKCNEVVNEVNRNLQNEDNLDNDCVSLNDICVLLNEKRDNLKRIIEAVYKSTNDIIKSEFGESAYFVINEILYYPIEFKVYLIIGNSKETITFTKNEGKLIIKSVNSLNAERLLNLMEPIFSDLYDELMSFNENKLNCINAVNSNFLIKISNYALGIYLNSFDDEYIKNLRFYLDYEPFFEKFNCNLENVRKLIKDNEAGLFSKIFIKIDDCPEWMQSKLYLMRQNQIISQENGKKYLKV